jgi:hypothetical protein
LRNSFRGARLFCTKAAVLLEQFAAAGLTEWRQKRLFGCEGGCVVAAVSNFNVEKLARSLRKMRSGF